MSGNSEYSRRVAIVSVAASLMLASCAKHAPELVAEPIVVEAPAEAPVEPTLDGKPLYMQHCATCHMGDGGGVPNFQPALRGSPIVEGPREELIATIWAGSSFLASKRESPFGNTMPPFGYLKPAEADAIARYVQEAFSAK